MDVTLTGKPTEVQLAIDALDLLMDVQQTSAPEATGDGTVRVRAVVVDPAVAENQQTDAELTAEVEIPLAEVVRMSLAPADDNAAEGDPRAAGSPDRREPCR